MSTDPRVAHWLGVPDGSNLMISVTGTTATTLVTAIVEVQDDTAFADYPYAQFQPGPLAIALRSPRKYSIDVDLHFATDAQAQVTARIVTPSGAAFGNSFNATITGTKNTDEFVSFFTLTA